MSVRGLIEFLRGVSDGFGEIGMLFNHILKSKELFGLLLGSSVKEIFDGGD